MSRILLLEDDLSLINGLSFAFRKQGFTLDIARTLKEAEGMWGDGKVRSSGSGRIFAGWKWF